MQVHPRKMALNTGYHWNLTRNWPSGQDPTLTLDTLTYENRCRKGTPGESPAKGLSRLSLTMPASFLWAHLDFITYYRSLGLYTMDEDDNFRIWILTVGTDGEGLSRLSLTKLAPFLLIRRPFLKRSIQEH